MRDAPTREQNRRDTCPRHRNAGACPIRPNESGSDKPLSQPLRRSMATASLIGLVQWDLEPTHIRPYTRGMGRAPTSRRIRTALHPDRHVGPELVLSGQVGDLESELFVDGCRDAMRSGSRSLRSRRRGRTRVPSPVTARPSELDGSVLVGQHDAQYGIAADMASVSRRSLPATSCRRCGTPSRSASS